jgi:hypothetical protein
MNNEQYKEDFLGMIKAIAGSKGKKGKWRKLVDLRLRELVATQDSSDSAFFWFSAGVLVGMRRAK